MASLGTSSNHESYSDFLSPPMKMTMSSSSPTQKSAERQDPAPGVNPVLTPIQKLSLSFVSSS